MNSTEAIFFWSTILFLAMTFFIVLLALMFKKEHVFKYAQYSLLTAFASITTFGILRWTVTGHPPFVTLFESMITSIWFLLLFFIILLYLNKKTILIILPVSVIAFLMMGWASSLSTEASELSAALTNAWLFIHASFATSGASSFLIGASFSILYLMGEEKLKSYERIATKVPEYKKLPQMILNFLIFGLILWGVMIVSGSIWAHIAWGRYWAWDPIELWSLISWLLFGLVIHTKLTFKISQKTFCKLTIIAAATVVFSLWGVGYIYETIHTYG